MSENDGGLRVDMIPAPTPIPVEAPVLVRADATAAPDPAVDAPALGPDQVRLSKGQVVRVRETNGLDDEMVDRLLSQKGAVGQSMMAYGRVSAICAISEVDEKPIQRIRTVAMLDSYLLEFKTRDIMAIVGCYNRVNGLDTSGDGDTTFR